MCSLSVKVLSNYLHLQAHCDKLKAFRIAQFFQNSKIQKITVKKIFFQNFDTGFLLIGVFRVYSRSFIAKLAKTKKSISSETNPTNTNTNTRAAFTYEPLSYEQKIYRHRHARQRSSILQHEIPHSRMLVRPSEHSQTPIFTKT